MWNTRRVQTNRVFLSALVMSGLFLSAGCDSVDECSSLRERLAEAQPGDVVRVGACTLPGDLLVPAGVTLEGIDSATSAIDALPGNLVAITLDTQPDLVTVVRGLRVLGHGVAIEVQGSGSALVEDVDIDVESGRGVVVEGAASAEFRRLSILGPISPENAGDEEWVDEMDSVGISLTNVASVRVSDVVVDGMAWAGFVTQGSDVSAQRLSVRHTLGYGVVAQGGDSSFVDLEVSDTYQGLRGEPSIAFAARDATWNADGFLLQRSERYGVVAQGGSVAIDGLDAQDGGDAALWVGDATAFHLGGDSSISDMRFAAVILVDSVGVDVQNLNITNVAAATRSVGAAGLFATLELGDGLHLIGDLRRGLSRRGDHGVRTGGHRRRPQRRRSTDVQRGERRGTGRGLRGGGGSRHGDALRAGRRARRRLG